MDLLRFLLLLPLRLVRGLLVGIGLVLRPLVGQVNWSAPAWLPTTGGWIRRRPMHAAGLLVAVLGFAAAGWFGWQWYQNRPKPVEPLRIALSIDAPSISDYTRQPIVIYPLTVRFSKSAAPIEQVGKPVTAGITMQPAAKGQWTWVDDRTLRFVPSEDWPVGKHYEVRFDTAKAFASHVLMAEDHFSFDTAAFEATAQSGEFYQDPQDATAKKTIFPVSFNYPVDSVDFEKRVGVALAQRGSADAALKFTVTYDPTKLHAWIHSQPLALPRDEGAVLYSIGKGVRSVRGGDGTTAALNARVRVPGLYSLSIDNIAATLVDNDKYEPEQVLVVNVGGSVRDSELAGLTKAWVLPKRKRGESQGNDEPPYAWDVSEVGEAELRQSQPLKLELVPTENDYEEVQSFKYHAEPGQRIYVRVDKGLKSFGGYILGQAHSQVITVPNYPKLLRFMADGSLLSVSGSKRLSVVSRNLPGMRVEIGRVLPDQLQHLVSFNQGSFAKPELSYAFSEDHIVERFEQKRSFPQGDPTRAHYEGVDLGQYLKDGKRGVFLLHLSSYDAAAEKRNADAAKAAEDEPQAAPRNDMSGDGDGDGDGGEDEQASADEGDGNDDGSAPGDTRLIVVTDLGMLVKRSLDGSQDVFVQSIRSGQPVAGASVAVLAVNGQTLYSDTTSTDGVVRFPTFKGLEREKQPTLYVVKKGEDLSFLPIGGYSSYDRKLDFSRFDVGGERNAQNEGQLSAYLFSDRGIYRPGDTFHVGLIVRAASWTRSVVGIPLQAEIVDPRGMTVKQLPLSMDASGFGELAYTPAETAATGTWTVNLYIVKNGEAGAQIGSTTVQVKEFLPDRMKVEAKLAGQVSEGWVKPDQLKGMVDVMNLFGTPAADRRVEASLTLRPAWPAFRSWPDYHFYDARRAKEGYEDALQDGKTDDKGHAEFDLDLKKYADATYQLYFLAKAYEPEGGRSVAAAAQTLVSSNDWLVGYKSVDNLDYVNRGRPAQRASGGDRSHGQVDRAERAEGARDRATLRLGAHQAGFGRLQVRVQAEGNTHRREATGDSRRRPGLHAADRQAGQLRARHRAQQRWPRGQPRRVLGGRRCQRLALAGSQRRAAAQPQQTGLRTGRERGYRGARAVCRQRPDHHRARQGLRARLVPRRHQQFGAAHHGAGRLRGQRLCQRAIHPRSVVGRDLHEPVELWRGAVLGESRRAPRCDQGGVTRIGEAGRDGHLQAAARHSPRARWCSRWTRASCRWRATSWAIR